MTEQKRLPYITVYSRNNKPIVRLKAYATRGNGTRKINLTAPIFAPAKELWKFGKRKGCKVFGLKVNPDLQKSVIRFFLCCVCAAFKAHKNGTFESITSKDFSAEVYEIYFNKPTGEKESLKNLIRFKKYASDEDLRNYDIIDFSKYFRSKNKKN